MESRKGEDQKGGLIERRSEETVRVEDREPLAALLAPAAGGIGIKVSRWLRSGPGHDLG